MADSQQKSGAFLSVALCWMFYLFAYVIRVEPSVVAKSLIDEFGITSSVIGFLGSVAYLPYVAMQIPCGVIADKLGTKTVVSIGCSICSLGAFIFGSANSVLQLEVGRFLIGLSTSCAFLCCGKVATEFFDRRKYAMFMGIAMCMGCLGGIAGSLCIADDSRSSCRHTVRHAPDGAHACSAQGSCTLDCLRSRSSRHARQG